MPRWIDRSIYFDETAELLKDDEVTVIDSSGTEFWARFVSSDFYPVGSCLVCKVRDEHGYIHSFSRNYLHKRVWKTVAEIGFTSDKKHDSYATQFFMNQVINAVHGRFPEEKFDQVHIHSDNAAQHFKNSKTQRWVSHLYSAHNWIKNASWSFGCPGHGKGSVELSSVDCGKTSQMGRPKSLFHGIATIMLCVRWTLQFGVQTIHISKSVSFVSIGPQRTSLAGQTRV